MPHNSTGWKSAPSARVSCFYSRVPFYLTAFSPAAQNWAVSSPSGLHGRKTWLFYAISHRATYLFARLPHRLQASLNTNFTCALRSKWKTLQWREENEEARRCDLIMRPFRSRAHSAEPVRDRQRLVWDETRLLCSCANISVPKHSLDTCCSSLLSLTGRCLYTPPSPNRNQSLNRIFHQRQLRIKHKSVWISLCS